MNKLVTLIANGDISVEELASAKELIERAELVKKGVEACAKTLLFPLWTNKINCYHYMDTAGEYESWGSCTSEGVFTCSCNWGGNHVTGSCNLTSFKEVFMAFENKEFKTDLERFLRAQIKEAEAN